MLVTLSDVLPAARKGGYAVGLFNTVNLEMARAVVAAAEALRSPVILGTAEILLPYGPMAELADLLLPMARRATVPVVVHYDHGLTFENTLLALRCGFSSVMYDRSTRPYADNLADVREMARLAHRFWRVDRGGTGARGQRRGLRPGTASPPLPPISIPIPRRRATTRSRPRGRARRGRGHGARGVQVAPEAGF
jgi:fructose-bisphosphate aldolase class II